MAQNRPRLGHHAGEDLDAFKEAVRQHHNGKNLVIQRVAHIARRMGPEKWMRLTAHQQAALVAKTFRVGRAHGGTINAVVERFCRGGRAGYADGGDIDLPSFAQTNSGPSGDELSPMDRVAHGISDDGPRVGDFPRAFDLPSPQDLPMSARYNNPGNLNNGDFARSQPGYSGDSGRFARFETPDTGQMATGALLDKYAQQGINTPHGIISKFAPPSENDTRKYAQHVANTLGVGPHDRIDLSDPGIRAIVSHAITHYEGGRPADRYYGNWDSGSGGPPHIQPTGDVQTAGNFRRGGYAGGGGDPDVAEVGGDNIDTMLPTVTPPIKVAGPKLSPSSRPTQNDLPDYSNIDTEKVLASKPQPERVAVSAPKPKFDASAKKPVQQQQPDDSDLLDSGLEPDVDTGLRNTPVVGSAPKQRAQQQPDDSDLLDSGLEPDVDTGLRDMPVVGSAPKQRAQQQQPQPQTEEPETNPVMRTVKQVLAPVNAAGQAVSRTLTQGVDAITGRGSGQHYAGGYTQGQVQQMVVAEARRNGIDPNIALRVFGSEGRSGYAGDRDGTGQYTSFGPMQLHYAGHGGGMSSRGMGDDFTKATGLNARDPSTIPQQIAYAMQRAAQGGWGPWHGAQAIGLSNYAGIGGRPDNSGPSARDFQANAELAKQGGGGGGGQGNQGGGGQQYAQNSGQQANSPAYHDTYGGGSGIDETVNRGLSAAQKAIAGAPDALQSSRSVWIPLLTGLGAMASSDSRYLGSAILQGMGAGAQAYGKEQQNEADLAGTYAGIGKTGADIGRIGAETGRLGAETSRIGAETSGMRVGNLSKAIVPLEVNGVKIPHILVRDSSGIHFVPYSDIGTYQQQHPDARVIDANTDPEMTRGANIIPSGGGGAGAGAGGGGAGAGGGGAGAGAGGAGAGGAGAGAGAGGAGAGAGAGGAGAGAGAGGGGGGNPAPGFVTHQPPAPTPIVSSPIANPPGLPQTSASPVGGLGYNYSDKSRKIMSSDNSINIPKSVRDTGDKYVTDTAAAGEAATTAAPVLRELFGVATNAAHQTGLAVPGAGSAERMQLVGAWNMLGRAMGLPEDSLIGRGEADNNDALLQKQQAILGAMATHGANQNSLGALQSIMHAYPNMGMPKGALTTIAGQLMMQNQQARDRYDHYQSALDEGGMFTSYAKANRAFNAEYPSQGYEHMTTELADIARNNPGVVHDLQAGKYTRDQAEQVLKKLHYSPGLSRVFFN